MVEEILQNQKRLKSELLERFQSVGLGNLEAIKLVVEVVFEKNQIELLEQTEYTTTSTEDNNNDKAIEKWRKWI